MKYHIRAPTHLQALALEEHKDDLLKVPRQPVVDLPVRVQQREEAVHHGPVPHRHERVEDVVHLAADDLVGAGGVGVVGVFEVGGGDSVWVERPASPSESMDGRIPTPTRPDRPTRLLPSTQCT